MNWAVLVPPLIGLLAPLVVSAIRMSSTRLQDRTARLAYWKAYLDLASAANIPLSEGQQQLCQAELADAEDEVRNLREPFLTWVTNIVTGFLMLVVSSWVGSITTLTIKVAQCQIASKGVQSQLGQQIYASVAKAEDVFFLVQLLLMCLIWFWGRWFIRMLLWRKLRADAKFGFILSWSDNAKKLSALALSMALLWCAIQIQTVPLLAVRVPVCPS